MKWNKWDSVAFLEGVIGLSAEERGFYITLISLQYARAPHGHVTDELVIKAMACRPQVWRRVKAKLIVRGKVRETDGKLTANRVETEVKLAVNRMDKHVVSDTKSHETNGLDGVQPNWSEPLRARATTTTRLSEEEEENLSKGFSSSSSSRERAPTPPSEELAERRRRVQQELAEMTDDEVKEWNKQARGPNGAHHRPKL